MQVIINGTVVLCRKQAIDTSLLLKNHIELFGHETPLVVDHPQLTVYTFEMFNLGHTPQLSVVAIWTAEFFGFSIDTIIDDLIDHLKRLGMRCSSYGYFLESVEQLFELPVKQRQHIKRRIYPLFVPDLHFLPAPVAYEIYRRMHKKHSHKFAWYIQRAFEERCRRKCATLKGGEKVAILFIYCTGADKGPKKILNVLSHPGVDSEGRLIPQIYLGLYDCRCPINHFPKGTVKEMKGWNVHTVVPYHPSGDGRVVFLKLTKQLQSVWFKSFERSPFD